MIQRKLSGSPISYHQLLQNCMERHRVNTIFCLSKPTRGGDSKLRAPDEQSSRLQPRTQPRAMHSVVTVLKGSQHRKKLPLLTFMLFGGIIIFTQLNQGFRFCTIMFAGSIHCINSCPTPPTRRHTFMDSRQRAWLCPPRWNCQPSPQCPC